MTANENHKLTFSVVESRTATQPAIMEGTWAELKAAFTHLFARTEGLPLAEYLAADRDTRTREKDGQAWVPASFKSGGSRRQEDVEKVYLLVLDVDKCESFERIESALSRYEYLLHSSYSHSPEHPKCRVVLPLAKPIDPALLPALFDHFNNLIGGLADLACGHDPARIYYLPSCPKDAAGHFVFTAHAGELVDPDGIAASASISVAGAGAHTGLPATAPDFDKGYGDGERTRELTRRAGWCFAKGMTLGETIIKCLKWNGHNTPPLADQKVVETCGSIEKTHLESKTREAVETLDELSALNDDYAWVRQQARIFRLKHADFISPSDFRCDFGNRHVYMEIKGRSKLMSLGEAWLKWPERRQHRNVIYAPGQGPIVDASINLWSGWGCEAQAGDIAPWNGLLEFLFEGHPDKRCWFEQWLAFPLQNPGAKLATAVLLWSTRQGVGKTLVGETISKLYGAANACTISAAELHASFNGWAKGRQFILGEENASADHRADSNRLKHLITGDTIGVNEKHQPMVFLKNTMNFLFTSNHPNAFHLETHDRRFFIWEIVGAPLPAAFYGKYVRWVDAERGKEALMHHLCQLDLTGFDAKAPAPMTESKAEMQELSRSDLERWLSDLADPDQAARVLGKEIVSTEELVEVYGSIGRGRTNTTAVGTALRRVGVREPRRVTTRRGRMRVVAICRQEHWRAQDNDRWASENDRVGVGHMGKLLAAMHLSPPAAGSVPS